MDDFLRRLAPRPSDYGGLPSKITREDDAGNVYDETGRRIFNKFDQTEQPDSWLDTAVSTATAPAKLATALVGSLNPYGQDGWQVPPIISEPAAAFARSGELTGFGDDGQFYLPNVQNPQVAQDTLTQLMTVYGGNALGAALKPKPVQNALPQSPLFNLAADDVVSLGGSQIRYRPGSDGSVNIRHLSTPEAEAGRGQARQLMEGITRQADEDGVPLTLDAQAWEPQTDVNKLRSFYSSLGFRDVDGSGFMRRDPSINSSGGMILSDNRPSLMGSALASQADALPMDQASRLQRARDMGFDTDTPVYHGTYADFENFDNAKIGSRFGTDDKGHFFTTNKEAASQYATNYTGSLRDAAEQSSQELFGKPLQELYRSQRFDLVEKALKHANESVSGGAVYPVYTKSNNPMNVDRYWVEANDPYGASFFDDAGAIAYWDDAQSRLKSAAQKRGHDAIHINDGQGQMRVVFDPSNIRSVNAAFDPARAGENGLLLSDNTPSLLGSALASGEPAPASIRAYHGMDGPVVGDAFNGPSFWATDRPATASRYAEGLHRGQQFEATAPNVLPVDMTGKIYDATGLENKIGVFDVARKNAREAGADIIKHLGGNYEAINRGTVRSATTGETLFSDNRPSIFGSALASAQSEEDVLRLLGIR